MTTIMNTTPSATTTTMVLAMIIERKNGSRINRTKRRTDYEENKN